MFSLLGLLPVAAAVGSAAVEESLVAYAVAVCEAESAQVTWLGIGHALPGGEEAQLDWDGDPCRSRPELRLRIVEQGDLLVQVPVRPGLEVWVRTSVAPQRVLPGEDFEPVSGLVQAHEVRGNPVGEGAWRSRVTLREGQSVTTGLVVRIPDVERGANVTVTIVRGNLRVNSPGHLVGDGYLGESVRVVNEATRVVAEGLLVSPDTVRIP